MAIERGSSKRDQGGEKPKFVFMAPTGIDVTPEGAKFDVRVGGSDRETVEGFVDHLLDAHGFEIQRGESPMAKAVGKSVGMPGERGWGARWQPTGADSPYARAQAEIRKRSDKAPLN